MKEIVVFVARKSPKSRYYMSWNISILLLPVEISTADDFAIIMLQEGGITKKKLSSNIVKDLWNTEKYHQHWKSKIDGEDVYWLDYIKDNREKFYSIENLRELINSLYNRSIPEVVLGTYSIQVSSGYVVKI